MQAFGERQLLGVGAAAICLSMLTHLATVAYRSARANGRIHLQLLVCLWCLLMSVQGRAQVVSIVERPIPVHRELWIMEALDDGYFMFAGEGTLGADEFLRQLTFDLKSLIPVDFVLLAEQDLAFVPVRCKQTKASWRDVLKDLAVCGYSVESRSHHGIVMISVGRAPVQQIDTISTVDPMPPMSIVAQNGAAAVDLLHRLSPAGVYYDQSVIERELKRSADAEQTAKGEDRGLKPIGWSGLSPFRRSEESFRLELLFGVETSRQQLASRIADRLGCVARIDKDGAITIEPPSAGPELDALLAELLVDLKNPTGGWDRRSMAMLPLLGDAVAPRLISELNRETLQADELYYSRLVDVLSHLPSVERDTAFLNELARNLSERGHGPIRHHSEIMIRELGRRGDERAASVIAPSLQESDWERRYVAVVAMNCLGHPSPRQSTEHIVDLAAIPDEVKNLDAFAAFVATVDQVFRPGKLPLSVDRIATDNGLLLESALPDGGSWVMRLVPVDAENYQVHAWIDYGPFRAEGFDGRVMKREGRWLIVSWANSWRKKSTLLARDDATTPN